MSTRTQSQQLGLRAKQTAPAVQDQAQREAAAFLGRDERVEVELGLHRVGLVGELEPARQPPDVRVDGQTGQVERHRPHDVAGLAPDARQLHQVVELGGHLTAEVLVELARHPEQALRLRAEEPGGVHDRLDSSGSACARSLASGTGEQLRRDLVDVLVGGLRREDRRREQLERVLVHQRALGVGVLLREAFDDDRGAGLGSSWTGHAPDPR